MKLRRTDPDTERPFRVSGGPLQLKITAYVPMALILISILFCTIPLSLDPDTLASVLPITIGTVLCIAIGEILIAVREKKNK